MAITTKTPGVYIEEVSKFPPSVAQVETAIPAFIGYTEIAKELKEEDLRNKAVRITSMRQFELLFGKPPQQAFTVAVNADNLPVTADLGIPSNKGVASDYRMYYALEMFYANGGGACYVISVGGYASPEAIDSSALGTNGLNIVKKVDEVTLLVFPDAAGLAPASYHSLYDAALQQCASLRDRFTIIDIKMNRTSKPTVVDPHIPVNLFRSANIGNSANFKYGAAYYPWLKTVLNYQRNDASIHLEQADSGTLDGKTLATARADNPELINNLFEAELKKVLNRIKVDMPPSPIIAGIYAATDNSRGVWKAPANVGVSSVIEPTAIVSHNDQMDYNVHPTGKSVNAIRSFVGKGTMVWGARTLAGNDNEWRYVPVRRFFNMAEESIKKATEQFVFEPNDANTWVKVRAMIENFLTIQWRDGALAGAKPEHAFYVNIGLGKTMTAQDILEGRMIVEIGMAVVRPAEFIILKFSHKMQES